MPVVYKTNSSATAIEVDEWTYEVHETPSGIDLYQDAVSWTPFLSCNHAHSAGQALARLHRASEGYEAPVRKLRSLVAGFTIFAAYNPAAELDRYIAARPALSDYTLRRCCWDEHRGFS